MLRLDLAQLIAVLPDGDDQFVGESPSYDHQRVYGGQAVAQALWAAAATVERDRPVHSLHAYFLGGGDVAAPLRYAVERTREGRSFSTRRVDVVQDGETLATVTASFQQREGGLDHQADEAPAGVPRPEDASPSDRGFFVRASAELAPGPDRSRQWLAADGLESDDPVLHACALAFLSDYNAMDAVLSYDPAEPADGTMAASLDHSIWFHRPARADEWLLFDVSSRGTVGSRGLAVGSVFAAEGVLIATIAQEGVVRERRA
ncbi:MAG: thioesterase family protein [Actinomycetota bacterium]|nr:thioesterase family protein [Actinomycetota bacterium]